jgi:hypothetical protein
MSSPTEDHWAAGVLRQAAVLAGRAPSIHNSQPWRWRAGARTLDLFLARDRLPGGTDPQARFAVLSCGAALHHARVQIAAQGADAVVERMPESAGPDHLARIRIGGRMPVDPDATRLALAAETRRSDRRGGAAPPLDTDKLRCVGMAVRAEGAALRTVRADQVYELAAAADLARRVMAEEPGWRPEITDWADCDRGLESCVPAPALSRGAAGLVTAGPDPHRAGTTLIAETRHRAAVFGVLHGPGDERPDWLRAGEALSAGWLTATRLDVSVLPLSAVVAVPAARGTIRKLIGGSGWPYLVLRFAAAEEDGPSPVRTPRLPATAVVEGL